MGIVKSNIQYMSPNQEVLVLSSMARSGANGLYRKGSFANQIIWDNRIFYFQKKIKRFPMSSLHIFRLVKMDVEKFVQMKKRIATEKKLPVNFYKHQNYDDVKKITATDLNNAYWTIAWQLGYISDSTHTKGLKKELKEVRLSALSSLGINKKYQKIKNGQITKEEHVIAGNEEHKKIYENIRNTCFKHMMNASKILGKDFIGYKTDCIYYKDTATNRKKVQLYFEQQELKFKQLVEAV